MKIILTLLAILISVMSTLILCEFALQHTQYRSIIPENDGVAGYRMQLASGNYDITPNFPTTTVSLFAQSFPVWSNALGCFDNSFDPQTASPFIYITGDSFTWGYVPHEDNWGDVLQRSVGVRTLTCGVVGYGTALERQKTEKSLSQLPTPSLIIVGYFPNDPINDLDPANDDRSLNCQISAASLACWLQSNWLSSHSILYNIAIGIVSSHLPLQIPAEAYARNFDELDRFSTFAQEHHTHLLIVLIPSQQMILTKSPGFSQVKTHLDTRGIAYLDLTPRLLEYADRGVSLYWPINLHLNLAGNEVAGLEVADYLFKQGYATSSGAETAVEARLQAILNTQ